MYLDFLKVVVQFYFMVMQPFISRRVYTPHGRTRASYRKHATQKHTARTYSPTYIWHHPTPAPPTRAYLHRICHSKRTASTTTKLKSSRHVVSAG